MREIITGNIDSGRLRKAHPGFGGIENVNKGESQPRKGFPLNNQKKLSVLSVMLVLMVTQPFAFTANMILNHVISTHQYSLDFNEIIKGIISAVVSIIGTYFYHKFKNKDNGKN